MAGERLNWRRRLVAGVREMQRDGGEQPTISRGLLPSRIEARESGGRTSGESNTSLSRAQRLEFVCVQWGCQTTWRGGTKLFCQAHALIGALSQRFGFGISDISAADWDGVLFSLQWLVMISQTNI